jgi:ABC-type nickel/cobalt efflux system permease component RcnA
MSEQEVPARPTPQERWARTRRQGRASYIVRVGILRFGLVYASAFLLTHLFFVWRGAQWNAAEQLVRFMVSAFVMGMLVGWWMWRSMERRFGPNARDSHEQSNGTPTI